MWFGAAYYPEHRDPAKWKGDLDRMAAAGVNALRVGEFAWKRFEPQPGQYDFLWMDALGESAAARGIRLLMCPPLRTAPAWLVEQDPSILMIDPEGRRLEFGSRYTFCILHPRLREQGLALAAAMAKHFEPKPWILGWHLDNEYGDEPDCHCPVCVARWHDWLKERYPSSAALNHAWGNVFWSLEVDRFEQVPTPRHTKTFHSPAHLLNWRRFRSEATVETVALHARALRDHGVKRLITTNHQALWNPRTDYYDLACHLDVCGTNYYPPYGDSARAIEMGLAAVRSYKQRLFHVHELRCGPHTISGAANNTPAPGEVMRMTMHTIANGAEAVFYFRWRACPFGCEQHHGAITGYDGQPTRIYDEVAETGGRLRRLAPRLEGTRVVSQAAVFYDFQTRWMMETGASWNGPAGLYMAECKRAYAGLRAEGINVDLVGRQGEFGRYRLLVVPFAGAMTDALAQRFDAFVRGGGTLVAFPLFGMRNEDAACYPDRMHPALNLLLDIAIADVVTLPPEAAVPVEWGGETHRVHGLIDRLTTGREARTLARIGGDAWFAGIPAIVERAVGRGRAIYVNGTLDATGNERLWAWLVERSQVERLLPQRPPPAVEVTARMGDDRRLLFLLNTSALPQRVAGPGPATDIWNEETLDGTTVDLPPHGVRILDLPRHG